MKRDRDSAPAAKKKGYRHKAFFRFVRSSLNTHAPLVQPGKLINSENSVVLFFFKACM